MKKIFCILLSIILLFSFAACGGQLSNGTNNFVQQTPNSNENASSGGNASSNEIQNSYDDLPEGLEAEMIGSVDLDYIYTNNTAGFTYKDENGKYGIMTLDGKQDTGAKYTDCNTLGDYFMVTTVDANSVTDAVSLNCYGVVDATGKEIIPAKYASLTELNERYIQVREVTEQTTNKDEALVYYTESIFSITAGDDDILFKGKWYVYDMVTGKMLDGVSGTNSYRISAYGNFIKYVTDAEEQITVNDKGEQLPEDADLFANGYYALVKDNAGAVYNSDHEKMFSYELDGLVPYDSEDEYIVASKYLDGVWTYVLMDTAGRIVSAEFADRPMVYGDLIYADEKVYNFEGNTVIEGTYAQVYLDDQLGNAWFLKNDSEYTLITKDGTVLYQGTEDDVTSFDPYSCFYIKKKVDDKNMYYCLADQDFTLEGSSLAPWLIQLSQPNYIYDVADAISGKTIISGYEDYEYIAVSGSVIYVYAEKADGGYDIYAVK